MLEIDDIAVDPAVPSTLFRCDLKRCKGACCTLPGGTGAPLLDEETEEIRKAFPIIRKYLSPDHLAAIESAGLMEGEPGSFTTACVNNRACVFVTFEDGIAKCSFEKAFFNREIGWRKPLSCHLFPIRIDRGMAEQLRFEYLSECRPALEYGAETETDLPTFVGDALVRAYGANWTKRFLDLCRTERARLRPEELRNGVD